MASAVIPCSVWDRALRVLQEARDPLAAHPKPRCQPGCPCAPRSGVVPAPPGSKAFQRTCAVRADAVRLGNGRFATVIRSRVLGPGLMHRPPHQLHHLLHPSLPGPSPPSSLWDMALRQGFYPADRIPCPPFLPERSSPCTTTPSMAVYTETGPSPGREGRGAARSPQPGHGVPPSHW